MMPDADLDDAYDDPVGDEPDMDELFDQPDEWRDFNDE
jgi:hypothetical protein